MCGICGLVNFDNQNVQKNILEEMNSALTHRGPDDSGTYIFKNVGIAHRRLSIIDLDTGKQPLSNEDKTIWLSFNGEIYNYLALKKLLTSKGHLFKTNTDSEVIVHLYEEYGKDSLNKLDGMFSFAIFDRNKSKIFIARDRMGQKPIYYANFKNTFMFSSELQALTKHPDFQKSLNFQSIYDYLTLLYIPAPNTIYNNVFKLLPGHYLNVDHKSKKIESKSYWKCSFEKKIDISYEDAKIQLKQLLTEAVEKRLMSDVPLGAFLSGGIDSSVITGLMSKITSQPVKTFTIGFEDSKYDERKYAKEAASKFYTNHHEKLVNPQDFTIIEKLVSNFGEPYADSSMLPTYLLSQFAKEKVTVALSGDGADELFAGYYRYLVYKYSKYSDILPEKLKKYSLEFISKLLPPYTSERSFIGKTSRIFKMLSLQEKERYLGIISRTNEKQKISIFSNELKQLNLRNTQSYFDELYNKSSASNLIEKLMELDINSYLPYDILTKIDITSMANSLELRSPFMDHKVVEFVNSLPFSFKQSFKSRKKILIDTFSDLLPKQLTHRNKMGFGVPISSWLRYNWKEKSNEILLNGYGIKNNIFSKEGLKEVLVNHQNNQADNSYLIWSLIIFELWYEKFMS